MDSKKAIIAGILILLTLWLLYPSRQISKSADPNVVEIVYMGPGGPLSGAEADVIRDTSGLNVHQLHAKVSLLLDATVGSRVRLAVMSFGFKYGVPLDADFVMDMRFLPNPFWVPELRAKAGTDPAVADYVLGQAGRLLRYCEAHAGGHTGHLHTDLPAGSRARLCLHRNRQNDSGQQCADGKGL